MSPVAASAAECCVFPDGCPLLSELQEQTRSSARRDPALTSRNRRARRLWLCVYLAGPPCERRQAPCTPNPCRNGGVCEEGAAGAVCRCAETFGGRFCDTSVDLDCGARACQEGRLCGGGERVRASFIFALIRREQEGTATRLMTPPRCASEREREREECLSVNGSQREIFLIACVLQSFCWCLRVT